MIEAMKQALEALETAAEGGGVNFYEYAKDLRQAIAEAEKHEVSQEPVQVTIKDFVKAVEGKEDMVGRPVYWAQWPNADTHPQPKREQDSDCQHCGGKGCVACDAREQEPVAWGIANTRPTERNPLMMVMLDEPAPSHLVVPLYTHLQPKREWVGLTDEDKQSIVNKKAEGAYLSVMQTIELTEAKLKEKNT